VDNEPVFRDAARRLLERCRYRVVAKAGCAASALDAVERFAPRAVLQDNQARTRLRGGSHHLHSRAEMANASATPSVSDRRRAR
jgi:DNA-binding NarL/FixJ family response regulator